MTGVKLPQIIIDTDAGHDDVLALMLLIKSGKFSVKAITTVAGNSSIENATRNATYTLDLLNKREIPIYSGNPGPLYRNLIKAVVHGDSGLDGVNTTSTRYQLTANADKKLTELIKTNSGQVSIVTLGPLTNLARAFIREPELPKLIKSVVIMGGAIDVCGNKNRVAEFNIFVDPEAADIVFRSEVPKILIPLDPCNNMPLFETDFDKLKDTNLYQPIKDMMKAFIAGIEKFEGTRGALVYDAIAAYYLINPQAFSLTPMDILIETKGEHTFGMTVVEKRKAEEIKANIEVAMQVHREQFVNDFFRILAKP